jgi:hypothetical protein
MRVKCVVNDPHMIKRALAERLKKADKTILFVVERQDRNA